MSDDAIEPPVAERRGRPAGLPKSGGRKPGTPNALTKDLKELILRRGKPVELLCDIARGVRIRTGPQAGPAEAQYVYPNLQDRAAAARVLLDRVLPAMKATELTGADGGPVAIEDTPATIEARAVALGRLGRALQAGLLGQGKPAVSAVRAASAVAHRILSTPSGGQISRPIGDAVHVTPDDGLPLGYTLEPTADGVQVLYEGRRVFHAASHADGRAFISQHRPSR